MDKKEREEAVGHLTSAISDAGEAMRSLSNAIDRVVGEYSAENSLTHIKGSMRKLQDALTNVSCAEHTMEDLLDE